MMPQRCPACQRVLSARLFTPANGLCPSCAKGAQPQHHGVLRSFLDLFKKQVSVLPTPPTYPDPSVTVPRDPYRTSEPPEVDYGPPAAFKPPGWDGTLCPSHANGWKTEMWSMTDPTIDDMELAVKTMEEAYEPFGSPEAEAEFLSHGQTEKA